MVCSSSQCQGRTFFCYDCGVKLEHDHGYHDCVPRNIPIIPNVPIIGVRPRPRHLPIRPMPGIINRMPNRINPMRGVINPMRGTIYTRNHRGRRIGGYLHGYRKL